MSQLDIDREWPDIVLAHQSVIEASACASREPVEHGRIEADAQRLAKLARRQRCVNGQARVLNPSSQQPKFFENQIRERVVELPRSGLA